MKPNAAKAAAGLAVSFANGIRVVVSNQVSQRLHVYDGIEAPPGFHEFRVTCEDFDAAREGHHLVDSHHDHKRAVVEKHPRFFSHACSPAFSRRPVSNEFVLGGACRLGRSPPASTCSRSPGGWALRWR